MLVCARGPSPRLWLSLAGVGLLLLGLALVPSASAQSSNGGLAATTVASSTPYADLIERTAKAYSLDPFLLAALIRQESGFRPRVTSRAGARGLTQLMPATARGLGLRVDRRRDERVVPSRSVVGGARYLREQLDRFGRTSLALAAYNAGPGAVRRFRGVPPYRETRNYVRAVLAFRAQYRRQAALD